ncbi:MAG TPA: hypothetical protein VGR62_20320 [Candidatus Binatia bacterium]|nr:hypothetical protein [Candidatus Binatia bacterium]
MRIGLVGAWVAACGLLLGAACPAPYSNSFIGVHGNADDVNDQPMDMIKNAGFKWFRVQIQWPQVEQGDDSYVWTQVDERVANAANRGFSILMYFHGVPHWANNAGPNAPPLNVNRDKFGDFVRDVINHQLPGTLGVDPYPAGLRVGQVVASYEIWNEPNGEFWSGDRAEWKDRILRPAIAAIKTLRVDPPGFSPLEIDAPSLYINYDKGDAPSLTNWTSGYLADIDVVSVHTYGDRVTQLAEMGDVNTWCDNNLVNGCFFYQVTETGFETFGCAQANCDAAPGQALLATQNRCLNDTSCIGNFIFNMLNISNDSGLITNAFKVNNRLCFLEQNYSDAGPPPFALAVAEPCPCSAGKPGCSNNP